MKNSPIILDSNLVDVEWGTNVKIVKPCNLYGCKIGNYSFIGPFVEIQTDVVIGKKCRIQSHSFICSKVVIGDNCFIGHGVNFTNDLFKNGNPESSHIEWIPTYIGNNVSIGSGSSILPVKVADGCVVGAGSVVTKDLIAKGIYAGNPAKLIRLL